MVVMLSHMSETRSTTCITKRGPGQSSKADFAGPSLCEGAPPRGPPAHMPPPGSTYYAPPAPPTYEYAPAPATVPQPAAYAPQPAAYASQPAHAADSGYIGYGAAAYAGNAGYAADATYGAGYLDAAQWGPALANTDNNLGYAGAGGYAAQVQEAAAHARGLLHV
mmetsp:Transcript_80790/g.205338  ORF Transcript_80790/g.205338 Transcript_80790/m.205338 type:complete len:165 (-) Transcript_80790:122-616(-)